MRQATTRLPRFLVAVSSALALVTGPVSAKGPDDLSDIVAQDTGWDS